jgi:1,4-dihydroxy-2-naphthoate octaprenyltransferase
MAKKSSAKKNRASNARSTRKVGSAGSTSGSPIKQAALASGAPKTALGRWVSAARVRTLGLAIAPVALGTGVASLSQSENWLNAGLALLVALSLQIGVNYANDYSDGIRGTDAVRVGPFRLTASKTVKATSVRNVAFAFFALGALAGLALVVLTQLWWLIAVGAVAILAAWFYTGGKKPYGYAGFGELVSFLFFGPIAVLGSALVQYQGLLTDAWIPLVALGGAVGLGFLAAGVLLVNNLRDIHTDAAVGKRTLSVRIGKTASQWLFTVLVVSAIVLLIPYPFFYNGTILSLAAVLFLLPTILIVFTYRNPKELVTALKVLSAGATTYGLLLGYGLFNLFL